MNILCRLVLRAAVLLVLVSATAVFGQSYSAGGGSATGQSATAVGANSRASSQDSSAYGSFSVASGESGSAFGASSTASGFFSSAFGLDSRATGNFTSLVWFLKPGYGLCGQRLWQQQRRTGDSKQRLRLLQ